MVALVSGLVRNRLRLAYDLPTYICASVLSVTVCSSGMPCALYPVTLALADLLHMVFDGGLS